MRASTSSHFFKSEPLHRLGKGVAWFAGVALLALGAAIVPVASAQTASGSTGTGFDNTGEPKSEMAACQSRRTPQDRATCLNEVRNAQAARRAGRLENYGDFAANALRRCEIFRSPVDLAACQARVEQGTIYGSVAEGGILREAEIEVIEPATSGTSGTSGTAGTSGASEAPAGTGKPARR